MSDGTAAAEWVPSENFDMKKTGPIGRGDGRKICDCAFMGAVPGHSTAPLGKLTVDAADFMFLTGCSNQFIPVESSLLLIQFSVKAP